MRKHIHSHLLLVLVFLLGIPFQFAIAANDDVSIEHPLSGEIILKAKNCSILQRQVRAVKTWAKKFDKAHEQVKSEFKALVGRHYKCSVDISDLIPKEVKEVYQNKPFCDGPNCFNSALISAKILPAYRYTTPQEISFWLNSSYCRERTKGEKMQPGDIIAIREKRVNLSNPTKYKSSEIHAFTYLTDELVLSKNGFSKQSIHSLYSPEEVFKDYGVPKECFREYKISTKCNLYANFFTCKSPLEIADKDAAKSEKSKDDDELGLSSNNLLSEPPAISSTSANGTKEFLCEIECQIQKLIWHKKPKSPTGRPPLPSKTFFKESLQVITDVSKGKVEEINEELSHEKKGFLSFFRSSKEKQRKKNLEADRLAWQSIYHGANSTLEQMNFIPSLYFATE